MDGWLQPIAINNAITIATNASRAMYNGIDPDNDPWVAIAWSIGIIAFFATWSTRQFARSTVA